MAALLRPHSYCVLCFSSNDGRDARRLHHSWDGENEHDKNTQDKWMYVEFCAGTKRFIVRETETWNMSICRVWNGLFSDFNPIFLFDRRVKTFPLHWHWLFLCLWQWIVSSFSWEIFNQKHADRFYGFFSYSFHSNQKTLRTNKSAFIIICECFSAAIYNVNFAFDMLSIVCCMHSSGSVSLSTFRFVDRTNWKRFKTMTKTNEWNWNKANEKTNWFET